MWRYYTIEGFEFYAPNEECAFGLARARWPFRKDWTLTGSRA